MERTKTTLIRRGAILLSLVVLFFGLAFASGCCPYRHKKCCIDNTKCAHSHGDRCCCKDCKNGECCPGCKCGMPECKSKCGDKAKK